MKPLRIALTKGRLEKDTVALQEKIGYDCSAIREKSRRLWEKHVSPSRAQSIHINNP